MSPGSVAHGVWAASLASCFVSPERHRGRARAAGIFERTASSRQRWAGRALGSWSKRWIDGVRVHVPHDPGACLLRMGLEPEVSVVIAGYDDVGALPAALDSVLSQDGVDF